MGFEVAYDPNQNIKIVKCIRKYPVIYNTVKYPPIEYRGVLDKTWEKVAKELEVSEGYVKGRWTNIKGCYKRYLRNKQKNSNVKSYYLAAYLDFMYPYMRLEKRRNGQSCNDTVKEEPLSDDEGVLTIDEAPEETTMGRDASKSRNTAVSRHTTVGRERTTISQDKTTSHDKSMERDTALGHDSTMDSEDFEVKVVDSDGDEESYLISTKDMNNTENLDKLSTNENPRWHFLASLLPDVRKMNSAQKCKFRNSVLASIDTILYGEEFV